MKNIIRIFLADMRRLSKNVVAVVVIMGLCIIPSLYAWFNIFPTGTRTDRIQRPILKLRLCHLMRDARLRRLI